MDHIMYYTTINPRSLYDALNDTSTKIRSLSWNLTLRFVEHLAFKKGEMRGWITLKNLQELIGAKEKGVTFGWGTSPHMHKPYNQISICEGKLFVCFVCHIEISQTMLPLIMLLIRLESPWLVRVHWGGLLMLKTTLQ
jgi:hypothetical protein